MTLAEAALLGLIQGCAEWLPISSEGALTAVQSLVFGDSIADAVNFSLWLHLGTALSALAAFRSDFHEALRDILARPASPSPATFYLIVATLSSAPIGFLLIAGLFEFSERVGVAAMGFVGILMLLTGALLLKSKSCGTRTRRDMRWPDAVLTGVAQGFAALPGLSRSGLTVSALLWRGVDRREALALSFLLSVPASLGAGLYAAISADYFVSPEALVALAVSAISGFAAIRGLMTLAGWLNFGWFALIMGAGIAFGALLAW